jgi:hypothetical protein
VDGAGGGAGRRIGKRVAKLRGLAIKRRCRHGVMNDTELRASCCNGSTDSPPAERAAEAR